MIKGQTAFITGAGSGLGAALARRFVSEGANVALVDLDQQRAHAVADELDSDKVLALGVDVRSSQDLYAAVDATMAKFGQIDTVIPNAGIWDYNRSITRHSGEELSEIFDEIFSINVKGYLLTVEATWRRLIHSRGSIIMTLSNASFYSAGGGPVYTASKFADRGLVMQFAYELAPKVRVNGVAVGGMRTDLRGPKTIGLDSRSFADSLDRWGSSNPFIPLHDISTDPATFTGPYVMLASPKEAGNITGTIIHADGGISARGFRTAAGGDEL
ncbi:SDR family NAD(P)-dependent oxidoreductase [Corynebacterium felinum]|uniref:NAD(P)-dependent dehydrogenase (Short-subunit alcohol dehydrogenase family) n=1 Tax=Corynebacterium felinum TaxID=131318 RepID=A0ABU2B862_9CORY|nr:SDR family NAD(P)-dependent oxidoreductase [Corynebacterium felinum]MDF5820742.1 SDR family NAD(P)-dependent oxidoreductase [Corynebacterium felinum]MDR7354209.1 NAD(P)-dependent dehydrogenase (short-subunit alcohol dehydrogenase family) [Corynebacterium felinum]WJY96378.1 Cis-2,3-dihydrobiphenyl-2,3-diol dehydrogenase [Corynebacterium felinum]